MAGPFMGQSVYGFPVASKFTAWMHDSRAYRFPSWSGTCRHRLALFLKPSFVSMPRTLFRLRGAPILFSSGCRWIDKNNPYTPPNSPCPTPTLQACLPASIERMARQKIDILNTHFGTLCSTASFHSLLNWA